MKHSGIEEVDTPALLVDVDVMEENLRWGQRKANMTGVKLRPHTKTHRTPALAKRQVELGAQGITVAKLGEAEVMAAAGINDIFIANEIVGPIKLKRLRKLAQQVRITVGVDNPKHVSILATAFASEARPLEVLIDVDTGYGRTGVKPGQQVLDLARLILQSPTLKLRGIFTHEGHSYKAENVAEIKQVFRHSQENMLTTARLLRQADVHVEEISVGATPALLVGDVLSGITEIRPGTYIFLDAAQGNILGSYKRCALTVLATVVNRPISGNVVIDAGVKALTAFVRSTGMGRTQGYGLLKALPEVHLSEVSDEHGVFNSPPGYNFYIGEKIEIIPNHACPTCNLYDYIYGIKKGCVVYKWPVLARGKSQ